MKRGSGGILGRLTRLDRGQRSRIVQDCRQSRLYRVHVGGELRRIPRIDAPEGETVRGIEYRSDVGQARTVTCGSQNCRPIVAGGQCLKADIGVAIGGGVGRGGQCVVQRRVGVDLAQNRGLRCIQNLLGRRCRLRMADGEWRLADESLKLSLNLGEDRCLGRTEHDGLSIRGRRVGRDQRGRDAVENSLHIGRVLAQRGNLVMAVGGRPPKPSVGEPGRIVEDCTCLGEIRGGAAFEQRGAVGDDGHVCPLPTPSPLLGSIQKVTYLGRHLLFTRTFNDLSHL